jgi:hypothetical protein
MNQFHACPGSQMMAFKKDRTESSSVSAGEIQSQLSQWPIQLHLISPTAAYYQDADVILAADCVAYALGNFHQEYLKGRSLAIACPKLDTGQEIYGEKITSWVDDAKIKSLNVLIMQVPCCMGLLNLAKQALEKAERKIPLSYTVVGVQGDILEQQII